jgi:hypothetical protein
MNCYFWRGVTVPPELEGAIGCLGSATATDGERLAAFEMLLAAGAPVGRGYAMDRFSMDQAQLRHGDLHIEVLAAVANRIHACARAELAVAPLVIDEATAQYRRGANHGSALVALGFGCDEADSGLVAKALSENEDPHILEEGCRTAAAILYDNPRLPGELAWALRQLQLGRSHPASLRTAAVRALGESPSDEVLPWLVDALDDDLEPSSSAARALLERDAARFAARVQRVVAGWVLPECPPYDVHEVRSLLAG